MNDKTFDEINTFLNSSKYKDIALFFNLGYVPEADEHNARDLHDTLFNKNSVRLILELIGTVNLDGQRILDLGCGRGGAISVVHKYFKAKQICGIDVSQPSIEFCKNRYPFANISFYQAEATNLQLEHESFDVVLMIELMQSGPEIYEAYRQVQKVLCSGGIFLHAGIFPSVHVNLTRELLAELFLIEQDRDVTHNVLLSTSADEHARRRIYEGFKSKELLNDFLIVANNTVFDQLKSRTATYHLMKMRKR